MLIGDILRHSARRFPNRTAIIEGKSQILYAALDARVNRLAHAVLGLNLKNGEKVAIMSTSRLEYALAYFAIARTGNVLVHLSTRSTVDDVIFMLNKVEATVWLFESRFAPVVVAAAPQVSGLRTLIAFGEVPEDGALPPDCLLLSDFESGHPDSAPEADIQETDPVAITFTGGTTGFPKGVVVSHKARCATAYASAIDFGLTEQDIVITSTPLFHTAGLFVWFTTAIMHGATVVLQPTWDPVVFVDIVEREKVTAAFLVPSQLNDVISQSGFSANRLASLKKLGYAGAPMGAALFARIQNALPAVDFTENYGQSETCPITVRCPWHPDDKISTVGRPAINVEIRIVDQESNIMPTGEIGEITVRAEHVFDGYYADSEQTAATFRNGDAWLWTGDLGFLDHDGFLTLVDRSKDMLVTGGENVYPAEIENVLYGHESVAECAVFGIPDGRLGEVAAAHIVLVPGALVSEDELISFCAARVAAFKVPRLVKFVAELPRTPVGKIRKSALREPYWKGRKKYI